MNFICKAKFQLWKRHVYLKIFLMSVILYLLLGNQGLGSSFHKNMMFNLPFPKESLYLHKNGFQSTWGWCDLYINIYIFYIIHFDKLKIMEWIYLIRVFCQHVNIARRFLHILLAYYDLITFYGIFCHSVRHSKMCLVSLFLLHGLWRMLKLTGTILQQRKDLDYFSSWEEIEKQNYFVFCKKQLQWTPHTSGRESGYKVILYYRATHKSHSGISATETWFARIRLGMDSRFIS